MSRAIQCDQCGSTLVLNSRGDDEAGEIAAWISLEIAGLTVDVCSRSCAVSFLESPEVIAAHDAQLEVITSIANTIRDERERPDDGGES